MIGRIEYIRRTLERISCGRSSGPVRGPPVREMDFGAQSPSAESVDKAGVDRQPRAFDHPGVPRNRETRPDILNKTVAQQHRRLRQIFASDRYHACIP